MNGQHRENIEIGAEVEVVLKADQKSGRLTRGKVAELLTSSAFHPHGIKVRLEDGQVGRVQNILSKDRLESL
ncbi:MAG: YwbE family protein [Patescibacteria group bacterium]|nr:YwbE family protein [Patescibacteria group bacterium]